MTPAGDNTEFEPDPLLDACLDELLGGAKPPDLKDQILRRLEARAGRTRRSEESDTPALLGEPVVVAATPTSARDRLRHNRRRSRVGWLMAVGGTSLVLLVGVYLVTSLRDQDTQLAANLIPPEVRSSANSTPNGDTGSSTTQDHSSPDGNSRQESTTVPDEQSTSGDADGESAATPATQSNVENGQLNGANDGANDGNSPGNAVPSVAPIPSEVPLDLSAPRSPLAPRSSLNRLAKQDHESIIQEINQRLREGWDSHGIVAAPAIDDEQWCQRAVSYLLGRAATRKEVSELLTLNENTRRQEFLDRLFGPDYANEYSTYWSQQWTGWLLASVPTSTPTGRAFRAGLENHLAERIKSDDGFDNWVYELLTATGSNESREADFNPATNYLLALAGRDDEKTATRITSESCRVLLGQRLQCAQCHTDPLSGMPQERFWQVASAFQPLQITTLRPGRGRLEDANNGTPVLSYKDASGDQLLASPADLLGQPLAEEGAEHSPRAALARNLISTPQLGRAVVNRLWAAALQYGFTMPVDSMSRNNPVSHPELVETLSEQVAAHRFDLRQLQRWIVSSEAFDRSDVMTVRNEADFPDGGSVAYFSRSYYRPVLFRESQDGLAWLAQGGAPRVTNTQDAFNGSDLLGSRQRDADDYRKPPDDGNKLLQHEGTMGQLIPMSELATVRALTNQKNLTPEQQMWHAFLLIRGREPSRAELDQARAVYDAAEGKEIDALERIFWVLLNTD